MINKIQDVPTTKLDLKEIENHKKDFTHKNNNQIVSVKDKQTSDKYIEPTSSPNLFEGFLAGTTRFLSQLTISLSFFGKGLLKYWFKYPIKMFRPSSVNPWFIFAAMAQSEGQKMNVNYMKSVYSENGLRFISSNTIPLIFANAAVGACLFNIYGILEYQLKLIDGEKSTYQPFLSGFVAGGFQCLLSTPLENIQKSIPLQNITRSHSMLKSTFHTFRNINETKSSFSKLKFLYHSLTINFIKDSLGFMTFFGVFEFLRSTAKDSIKHYELDQSRSLHSTFIQASSIVISGATAGMAFQTITYPFERIKPIVCKNHKTSLKGLFRYVTRHKLKSMIGVYKGIGNQFVRAIPPSSIALLVYEIARNQFWED